MTIKTMLVNRLETYAGLSALVGTRIYPRELPHTPTYPALTYQRIGSSGASTNGLRETRFQINCWGTSESSVDAVAAQVKAALEEWDAVDGSFEARSARIDGEIDLPVDDLTKADGIAIDVLMFTFGD